jgi:hypothetical protein
MPKPEPVGKMNPSEMGQNATLNTYHFRKQSRLESLKNIKGF